MPTFAHDFGQIDVTPRTENLAEEQGAPAPYSFTRGDPIDSALRSPLERSMNADFSAVRLHTGIEAESVTTRVDSPAVSFGSDIFMSAVAAPRFGEVLVHELVHVAQRAGAGGRRVPSQLSSRLDSAEVEATSATQAILTGNETPSITPGVATAATAHRFGAGKYGHGGIETEAGTGQVELPPNDPRRLGVSQMYSGNFMRDLNQLNVPTVMNALSGIPKDPIQNPKGDKIGGRGAHDITTAVIQALALIDLGPEAAALVTGGEKDAAGKETPDRIGMYRPEEHIDNPMGMGGDTDTMVKNTDPNATDPDTKKKVEIGEPRPAKAVVDPQGGTTLDADRDAQLQGSAVQGTQVENPNLYKVSGAGLQSHIYNSVEATKKRWLNASQLGPTPEGRSEFGAGSHAVEDYFSHSNFVEVALNSYIDAALQSAGKGAGQSATQKSRLEFADEVKKRNIQNFKKPLMQDEYYVDSLYDAKAPQPKKPGKGGRARKPRQAVTTGSFGGLDTKVSISHILLPKMPVLQKALLGSIDSLFGIARAPGATGGWASLKKQLGEDPYNQAGAMILEGFSNAGMVAPVPDLELEYKTVPLIGVSIPSGVKHLTKSLALTDAIGTYAAFYSRAQEMIGIVEKYASYAQYLVPVPVAQIVKQINSIIDAGDQALRKAIKSQVTSGLVAILDSLSGRKPEEAAKQKEEREAQEKANGGKPRTDDEEFEAYLGDALQYFDEKVDKMEEDSALEQRLDHGDLSELSKAQVESRVGPVEITGTEKFFDPMTMKWKHRTKYKALNPLPPSHSEISKDHEPHDEHHKEGKDDQLHAHNETEHAKGSPFFGLARTLAVDSVKHCEAQLQEVWSKQMVWKDTSLFGDGKKFTYSDDSSADKGAGVHDAVLKEADTRAAAEKDLAKDEGRKRVDATTAPVANDPDVTRLLNLVDEFVSHPDDTQWWKPVFDRHLENADNREAVFDSIRRRNSTRTARQSE